MFILIMVGELGKGETFSLGFVHEPLDSSLSREHWLKRPCSLERGVESRETYGQSTREKGDFLPSMEMRRRREREEGTLGWVFRGEICDL